MTNQSSLLALQNPNEGDKYKTLLESTKAIPWKLNWHTKQFEYIGPQIEPLLGWSQHSWLSAQDWIDRIHEDDRERIVNFCVSQSVNGVDHEADYRALTASGDYVWIRDVVHVVRDAQGETQELVGFMFDISERKKMEQALIELNHKLESLSYQDVLTGVANRRRFEETLTAEISRARRTQKPLALVMFDVDYFKKYNDVYGHLKGDECLTRVANAIAQLPLRSSDLFARYGGEEFSLILPGVSAETAGAVAEKCRLAVLALKEENSGSVVNNYVTVSAGVSCFCAQTDHEAQALIDKADKMLYQAKQLGRNLICVESSTTEI